jgi:hypothetical protein
MNQSQEGRREREREKEREREIIPAIPALMEKCYLGQLPYNLHSILSERAMLLMARHGHV